MKKFIYSLFFLLTFSFFADAQTNIPQDNPIAIQKAEAFKSIYQLDEAQNAKMLQIQNRKQAQLKQIESLENSDSALYLQKLDAIDKGTEVSIQLMLTQEQLKQYFKLKAQTRTERAQLRKQLTEQGLSKDEITKKILKGEE